jgi:hypothetical protein
MLLDLAGLLDGLESPGPGEGVFTVREIPGLGAHFVGRDDQSHACVLVSAVDGGYRAPLRLSGLDVQYGLECVVKLPGCPELRRAFTVIRCTAEGQQVERYFLYVMGSVVSLFGEQPRLQFIAETIMRLAAIFQRLSSAARESVTGLIGELVLIAKSSDPVAAIAAWRQDPEERYDFVCRDLRLDVKASMTRRRVHGLSYEQCAVPSGAVGVLASLFVERSAGGFSLEQLIEFIARRIGSDSAMVFRMQQTIADTLAADLPHALSFGFDFDMAAASLAFFDLGMIPAVRGALPPGVGQVRFVSDLSTATPIDSVSLCDRCSDFAAFSPIV